MKLKTAEEATKALKSIIRTSGRKPAKLQSDRGSEFLGAFKRYCDSQGISIFHVESELKACIVERVIGTLMSPLWRIMQHKNTFTWYKFLPDMVTMQQSIPAQSSVPKTLHLRIRIKSGIICTGDMSSKPLTSLHLTLGTLF